MLELEIPAPFDIAGAIGLDLAELIPAPYAAYGPLVREALLFFLGRLPQARIAAILTAQRSLPASAGAAERLVALMHECPTLHKVGQVLAHDARLAPALRERLQALESLPARVPMEELLPLILHETGRVPGLELAATALAEGSVAAVIPFTWCATPRSAPEHGVFKILKPGVAARLHEELEIWPAVGDFLEQRCADLHMPAVDYRETLDSVRGLLLHEIRLDQEQTHLAAAAERYADAPNIVIPRLLPLCTPHLTAMERIDGVKVTAARGLSPERRRRLGERLVDALLARPFWSPLTASPFHADPHAGNLLLSADDRLAILDWSLVVELGVAERQAIIRLVLDALAQDAQGMCRTLAGLARGAPAAEPLHAAVDEALHQVRQGRFPGLAWTTELLDRAATRARLRLPEEWVLFRKALHTLSGVIEGVSPGCAADGVIATAALARFASDLTLGAGLTVASGGFRCHLFAGDLVALWIGWPAALARYWQGHLHDSSAALGGTR